MKNTTRTGVRILTSTAWFLARVIGSLALVLAFTLPHPAPASASYLPPTSPWVVHPQPPIISGPVAHRPCSFDISGLHDRWVNVHSTQAHEAAVIYVSRPFMAVAVTTNDHGFARYRFPLPITSGVHVSVKVGNYPCKAA